MTYKVLFTLASAFLFSLSAWSSNLLPDCMDGGQNLLVNDAQVLNWKVTTKNQFLARGHIQGTLTKVFPDQNGHNHFEVTIGSNATDTIEVIYNKSFGTLPALRSGESIEACGDYITSNAPTSKYPASPDGAILHWVHGSNGGHAAGYVAVDGTLYGQGSGQGGGIQ